MPDPPNRTGALATFLFKPSQGETVGSTNCGQFFMPFEMTVTPLPEG